MAFTQQSFSFYSTPNVLFGSGAASDFSSFTKGGLGERIVLVTDTVVHGLGLCDRVLKALSDAGAAVVVFDAVESDPKVATVAAASLLAIQHRATGVVGIGGGSSLDVAKVVALLAGSGESLDSAWGVNNAKGPRLPLALLPTTAGTGSEATPIAILTLPDGEKRAISSPLNLPDWTILDPNLTLGLPPAVTAMTGMDAMVHAIEAYSSLNANNNPLSRLLAQQAMALLAKNIGLATHQGHNAEARGAMLLGSFLAGQAFANSPVAAVHALAYPIGGGFGVPHGLSTALMLPHVLRFNTASAGPLYAELASFSFPELASVAAPARPGAFVERLMRLSTELGLKRRLRDVGIAESDLPQMARDAMKQTRLLVNNPRVVSEADALAMYTAAW